MKAAPYSSEMLVVFLILNMVLYPDNVMKVTAMKILNIIHFQDPYLHYSGNGSG